jgi:hypothetical protein
MNPPLQCSDCYRLFIIDQQTSWTAGSFNIDDQTRWVLYRLLSRAKYGKNEEEEEMKVPFQMIARALSALSDR